MQSNRRKKEKGCRGEGEAEADPVSPYKASLKEESSLRNISKCLRPLHRKTFSTVSNSSLIMQSKR